MEERGFFAENPGTDIAVHAAVAERADRQQPRPAFRQLRADPRHHQRRAGGRLGGDKTAEEAMNDAVERGNELLRRFEAAN
jgi:sn-glycerol 3-phosphate transport system substrate-binding protein